MELKAHKYFRNIAKSIMGEIKEFKGLWWLPDTSDNQISGTLIVEDNKITLETIGAFCSDDPLRHFANGNAQYDVIWGISSEAKMISVFNCYASMSLNASCPFPVAKYSALVIAVGKHIKSLDELGNYDVKAYIEELSYWFRPDCLRFKLNDKKYTWSADLNNAHHITARIDEGCNLELQGEVRFSHNKAGIRVEIEQMSTLNFVFSKPISMRDAKHKVYIFEQFLSFATLSPVQSNRLLLIDKDNESDSTKNGTIEIFDKKEEKIGSPERFWEYLFVYETIKDTFPSIICKWYAEKEMFLIRSHLIDSVGRRGAFCGADFLIVAQAVEGFYCRFREDGLGLNEILIKLRKEFSDISIVEISDYDIDCIRDSRNFYSHLLPTGKKPNVLDGHELYELNHKLRKLLLCCMMNFIGFNNREINDIFSESRNSYLRMISKKRNKEPIE